MSNKLRPIVRFLVMSVASLALAVGSNVWAENAPAVGAKISGQQLQSWLDAKFSYAGEHAESKCSLLNVAQDSGRVLFIRCPNGWAEKLSGSARVVGDLYCTSFPVPNTPQGEDCVTWHSVGQWKFEQRKGEALDTSIILIPEGLTSPR